LAVNEPGSDTAQFAPSSSTPTAAGAAASAMVVLVMTVNAPATMSAATASATTGVRIFERAELMITRALLPGGVREATAAIDDHGCQGSPRVGHVTDARQYASGSLRFHFRPQPGGRRRVRPGTGIRLDAWGTTG
jgi:hypothetical protein